MTVDRSWVIAAALAIGFVACGDSASETATTTEAPRSTCPAEGCEFEEISDLIYADDALVNVYRPTQEGPWPVVVFVHGFGGSKSDDRLGWGFAENGVVAYLPSVSNEPPHLETIQNVACAVRYARATSADHGGDPDEIVVVGFSSGAAAGAVAALSGDDHTTGCVETGVSALPDAFVGYDGVYDWAHTETPREFHLLEQDDPETWTAIDPYAHVGENPGLVVRLIHGVDDDLEWFEPRPQVSEDLYQALLDAGYDVELTLIEGAGHSSGFAGVPQFDEMVAQTLAIVEPT